MKINDVRRVLSTIKSDILRELDSANYQRVYQLIDTYADFAQRFNLELKDDSLEDVVVTLSKRMFDSSRDIKDPDKKTVVFYDNIGTTACLALQYLRALADNGYRVVYIFESPSNNISTFLLDEAKRLAAETHVYSSKSLLCDGTFIGNIIREKIIASNASKLIMHSNAMGTLGVSLVHSIKGLTMYRLVPGDQHFWIGATAYDYYIEYRPYGWANAVYRRNIPAEKLYQLTFYPVIDEIEQFKGFPEAVRDKVIFAAGGSTYKFEGSDIFYQLVEMVLRHDNTLFLFMGHPTKQLCDLQEKFKNRILTLGYRKDFAQCINNIDVLINSYPFGGALFCQTAAYYSKPIVSLTIPHYYAKTNVEDMFENKEGDTISFRRVEDVESYIDCLAVDDEFRQREGNRVHLMVQIRENFTAQLREILGGKYNTVDSIGVQPNELPSDEDLYLKSSSIYPDYTYCLRRAYGKKTIFKFWYLIKDFKYLVDYAKKKL